ncbi:prohead protease/major capsid protein fusion protein [Sphingomonas sp. CV7422]|uniref:prohead protease/major capsid protein fusion protein n=1 Tax=Sphingomonas sp. CV7422 TaxID=3018036 RepID=UPI0022FE4441|nr:prohead protease/major capsid protein fusion protein [Sphingomonas sp. CV7422]
MTKPTTARPRADDAPRQIGDTVDAPLPPARSNRKTAIVAGALLGSAVAGMLTRETPGQRPGADPEERRQPQAGGRGTRSLTLAPDSYDADAHTVEAILSTGAAVQRYYFTEELEISAEAIDLARVAGGVCPLLDTHNQYEVGAQIGRVTTVRVEGSQLIGTLQFDQTATGQEIEARVSRGELRAISIGYRVTRWQITATDDNDNETWRAVAWELLEASLVPVPADPNAVVRSAPGTTTAHGSQEEEDMHRNLPGGGVAHPNANRGAAAPAQPAADTTVVVEPNGATRTEPNQTTTPAPVTEQRAAGVSASRILDLCGRSASLGSEFAAELIRANEATPLSEADLLGRVNERLISDRPTIDARAGASGTETEGYRQAVEDAVMLRANPDTQLPDEPGRTRAQRMEAAREFRGLTMMELARDYLGRTGINTRGMGRLDIAGAALGMRYGALTTSDFANALGAVTSRRVRAAFVAAPQTFRPIVSIGTLPDFKPAQIIGLGDAPALLNVPENGEFKRGAITDTGMTYRLYTYGRIIAITRQAIVNDDQNLFGRLPTMFGRKAADLESDLVWGILLSNPAMSDGIPLFHASHGNLAATGGDINVVNVGKGRQAMRQQKSNEGGFLNIGATYLIVGPAQETAADQFVAAITANTNSAVNPFAGRLQVIVEPRITDNSWMLSADPNAFDTIELDHLLGQEELFTDTRVGFDVDGVENKARLDVGAAALDYRGFYKSPAY